MSILQKKYLLKKIAKGLLWVCFALVSGVILYISYLYGDIKAEQEIFKEIDAEFLSVCTKYGNSLEACLERLY